MPPPDPRPRRRWLPLAAGVLAFFAGGAGATVAVAWYAVVRERWAKTTTESLEPVPKVWPVSVPKSWERPREGVRSSRWGTSVEKLTEFHTIPIEPTANPITMEMGVLNHHTAGWPLPALEGSRYRETLTAVQRLSTLWRISYGLRGVVNLPLRPLWPGFAANTLAYAALAWGLWQIPVRLRRRRRIKCGRCAGCGYSLAGLGAAAPCPECGAARTSGVIGA